MFAIPNHCNIILIIMFEFSLFIQESKFEELEGESVSIGDLKEVALLEKIKFPKEFFPQVIPDKVSC